MRGTMAKAAAERMREHRERIAAREKAAANLLVLLLAEVPDLVRLGVEGNPVYRSVLAAAERVRRVA
jgi:hypothetical protein